MKPPSAILNMNRGFSAFSSRRPLDRGSSRGGPGRSSRSPFMSSAGAEGAELTPPEGAPPSRMRRGPGRAPLPQDPRRPAPQTPPPDPPPGPQVPGPSTHYLSSPDPPFPPPASPCVPVHPTASPPPSLLALALWLWEGEGGSKGGCHPRPRTPKRELPHRKPLISPKPVNPPDFSLSPRYPGSGSISPGIPGISSSRGIFLGSSRSPSDGAGLGTSA